MAGPFRPATGPNTGSRVLAELARLWDQAAHRASAGARVTQKRLAEGAGVPLTTVNSWATGSSLPRDLDQLAAVGAVLARWADETAPTGRTWSRLLRADQESRSGASAPEPSGAGAGRPLDQVTDPFALEVHRPADLDGPDGKGLPALPPYVRRAHDERLAEVVGRAADGHSGIAVLVGGSSTGKTRACWEALGALRGRPERWRLWHPVDPTRPEAALATLARVGPRTVVWLNETQLYLAPPGGDIGERVAAALHTLLTDPERAPVLVLGTLWPEHWDSLTRAAPAGGTHPHSRAGALLAGADIRVPEVFGGEDLRALDRAADEDPRIAAAASAEGGRVTQYLAGVPELLARHRNAPAAARALIEAAMDARRLDHGPALPHALLAAAAPGYLTDVEWDLMEEDWLERGLAYTAAPCKGIRGPLTRIRPRSPGAADGAPPRYRLSDYLEQAGRRERAGARVPAAFWEAAERCADPEALAAFAEEAHARGLFRHAASLHRRAALGGNAWSALRLLILLRAVAPDGVAGVARQVADRVDLTNGYSVGLLIAEMRDAGAEDAAAMLLARDPVAYVDVTKPHHVGVLLEALRDAGDRDAVAALLARDPAAHADPAEPRHVAILLEALKLADAGPAVTVLLERRAAAGIGDPGTSPGDPFGDPFDSWSDHWIGLDWLGLAVLRPSGIPMTGALPDRPLAAFEARDTASFLSALRAEGERAAAEALRPRSPAAGRDRTGPAGHPLHGDRDSFEHGSGPKPGLPDVDEDVAARTFFGRGRSMLLDVDRRVRDLLVPRDDRRVRRFQHPTDEVFELLEAVGSRDHPALAERLRAVDLTDPLHAAWLVEFLMMISPAEGMDVLLARRPETHANLADLPAAVFLVAMLRRAGAHENADALAARVADVEITDPEVLSLMLRAMVAAGLPQAPTGLLDRVATVDLTDAVGLAWLVEALAEAGAPAAITALLARDPGANVDLTGLPGAAYLLGALQGAGLWRQADALVARLTATDLSDPIHAASLIGLLWDAGAREAAAALAGRVADAGMFDLCREAMPGWARRFAYGREPDGRPSPPWDLG